MEKTREQCCLWRPWFEEMKGLLLGHHKCGTLWHMLETYGDPSLPADENHGGDFWRFTPQGISVILNEFKPVAFYIAHAGGIGFHGVRK